MDMNTHNNCHIKKHYFRKDHYDGKNALYRLSAKIETERKEMNIIQLITKLSDLTVVPNEIVVFPEKIELHWYPNGYQMVLDYGQYLALILDYIAFIERIEELKISFLKRCLLEDPDRTVWGVPNEVINFAPTFSSDCFGLVDADINILYMQERLECTA
jgi:hypothetical protein